ncbi:hypothetical protein NUM3379_04320 [Kineococcus sp. NUM-3379]
MSSDEQGGARPPRVRREAEREQRRQQAAERRAREEAGARRRRVLVVTAVVAAVLALAAVVAAVLASGRDDTAGTGATPAGASSAAGGFVLPGTPDEQAPTVDVWLDFQCPFCRRLEESSGEELTRLAADGEARVVVHTLSFLDSRLGNDSSSRAAQGAAAAADQGRFAEYLREVFERQPEREGTGYTDADLEAAAREAGVGDVQRWSATVREGRYEDFVERVQEAMPASVQGTPFVTISPAGTRDAEEVDVQRLLTDQGPAHLREQVDAARSGS